MKTAPEHRHPEMKTAPDKVSAWALPGAAFILILSQVFFLGLNLSALYQEYQKASGTVESFLLDELGSRLDTLARLNLELERQRSLSFYVDRAADLSQAKYFLVATAGGKVLAGSYPEAEFRVPTGMKPFSGDISEFKSGGLSWLARPIRGNDGRVDGFIFLGLDESRYAASVIKVMRQYKWPLILAPILSVLLLVFVFKRFQRMMLDSGPAGRWRYLIFLGPFLLSQLAFYAIVFEPRQTLFQAQSQGVAQQAGRSLAADLDHLLSRNVPLEIVPNLSRQLERLRENLPVIGGLAVVSTDGRLLASAGEGGPLEQSAFDNLQKNLPAALRLSLPLTNDAGDVIVWLSPRSLRLSALRALIDSLTMTLVASLLLVELARLIIMRAERDDGRRWTEKPQAMRPVAFICIFALDMSLSFIPLKMAEVSPVLLGLPEAVVLGLPISAEMFMVGLAAVGGGFLVGRVVGWRFLFLCGLLLLALGYVLSGLAVSAAFFIAARAVSGLGYGFLNLGAGIFVVTRAGHDEKGAAMGEFTAGLFAGSLCGCAAGGLMADRLGFAPVFYAAAFIFLLVWVLVLFMFPKGRGAEFETAGTGRSQLGLKALLGFAGDRQVMNLGLLQVLPMAVISVGLLNYFLPIHMGRIGAGPAAVGQLNIVFALALVFLGPKFGRAIDASHRKYAYLALGGLFAALALPSFLLAPALVGALAGVIFLGLSNSISENGHPAYLLRLPAAKQLGVGPSISFYTAMIRVGQVLGPLAVGAALNRGGFKGLIWLGGAMAAVSILFALTARRIETE